MFCARNKDSTICVQCLCFLPNHFKTVIVLYNPNYEPYTVLTNKEIPANTSTAPHLNSVMKLNIWMSIFSYLLVCFHLIE